MTRFASIMGVAAVATLVLLSGCETPTKTDYTKDLDGTWTVTGLMIPSPDPAVQIPTDVTVVIVDGSGVNTGTFELTVAQTLAPPPAPQAETTATGTVKAESSSVLKVTLAGIMGPPTLPAEVTALKDVEQTLGYDLMDDSLKISGAVLAALGVTSSPTDELTLTKQMASN